MEWLTIVLSTLASAATSFPLGMFFERRKKNAEANGAELENVAKGLELYRDMLVDARQMIEILERRADGLEKQVAELRAENAMLKAQQG